MSPGPEDQIPDIADVHLARARIQKQVRITPVLNDADRIAFGVAFPHDGGIFTPAPFGVFSDVGGSIMPVVSPGDITPEGEVIDEAQLTFTEEADGWRIRSL